MLTYALQRHSRRVAQELSESLRGPPGSLAVSLLLSHYLTSVLPRVCGRASVGKQRDGTLAVFFVELLDLPRNWIRNFVKQVTKLSWKSALSVGVCFLIIGIFPNGSSLLQADQHARRRRRLHCLNERRNGEQCSLTCEDT